MSTPEKPKLTIELEPGDYLVTVWDGGAWAWKHDRFGTFSGHGGKLKRTAAADAISQLRQEALKHYGLDQPIRRYHESRGVEDLVDLSTFSRGTSTARCTLRAVPEGWIVRFITTDPDSTRSASFSDEGQMLQAAHEWKLAMLEAGLTLTGSRLRLKHGYYDVAWNLITTNVDHR
jgi:hypothetical protein